MKAVRKQLITLRKVCVKYQRYKVNLKEVKKYIWTSEIRYFSNLVPNL